MITATIPMREGKELVGENGQRYLLVQAMGQPNVWIAVDAATQEKLYIVKQPSDDDSAPGWPRFQHEMVMHEMFKDHDAIRPQVDRIPPTSRADPPKIVLELLQTTLWDARRKREFSDVELKQIMRQILLGLKEVHENGLVYADLKMENILISGFEPKANATSTFDSTSATNPDNNITAKLGDLGIVMAPIKGTVQPIAYRAPEVYFRHEISPAADIWSWGLIYCQLLEAQASFHKTGLYDELLLGSTSFVQKELSVRKAIATDFDLGSVPYYDDCALPYQGIGARQGTHWEALLRKGVTPDEISFLKWVLNPVPTERPSAQQILDKGWLGPARGEEGSMAASGSASATATSGTRTTTGDPPRPQNVRKRSEPSLFAKFYDTVAKRVRSGSPPKEEMETETESRMATESRAEIEEQKGNNTEMQMQTETEMSQQQQQHHLHQQEQQHQQHSGISTQSTPFAVDSRKTATSRAEKLNARPSTPRSSTAQPSVGGGATFLNYGAFMK